MLEIKHNCETNASEFVSTVERPYLYLGSGLSNVKLIGVSVFRCNDCAQISASIPSMKELHKAIARILVQKKSKLTGSEVRFLRKRLGKRSVDFAQMTGMSAVGLSALESNEARQLAAGRDRLVRLLYKLLSDDKKLKAGLSEEDKFEEWIMSLDLKGERESITATWQTNHRWSVTTEPLLLTA